MSNDNNSALAIVTKCDNGDSKTSIKISLSPTISEREEQLIVKLLPAALNALKDQEGDVTITRHEEPKIINKHVDIIFAKHRTPPITHPYHFTETPPWWD